MSGEAPHRRFGAEILFEIARPKDLAGRGLKAVQISLRAQRVNSSFMNRRRGARPGGITHGVGTLVSVFPKNFAVSCVQAEHPFDAGNRGLRERIDRVGRAWGQLTVHDKNSPLINGGTGVTRSDGCAPANRRAVRRKSFDDARFAPDTVALRAEPLRPI